MQLTDEQRYDFRTALEKVKKYEGRGTELISLYIPESRMISDVTSYLKNEYSQSSNIKSASTRKNVQSAISSILSRLRGYRSTPQNGLVLFIGHRKTGADQTSMIQFVLQPPEPITTFLYRCDSEFYIEPLEEMLEDKVTYGLIVLDRSEASIGLLKGKRIELIKSIDSLVPSKHHKGGQSARRFERVIEVAAHEYYKKVAYLAEDSFLDNENLEGIIVGGPGATKDYFISEEYLHHELQKKIVDTFDTGYTDEYGLRELVEKAKDKLASLDLMREKRLVHKLLGEIKKPQGGLAAYGEDQVKRALTIGAVDTLLISEDLRKSKVDLVCSNCGAKEERTISSDTEELICPKCSEEMEIDKEIDLVKELFRMADKVGTRVEMISGESEEGELLKKAFGGMAAILRFSLGEGG